MKAYFLILFIFLHCVAINERIQKFKSEKPAEAKSEKEKSAEAQKNSSEKKEYDDMSDPYRVLRD